MHVNARLILCLQCRRVDSISEMKAQLPKLRTKLKQDPDYFKKVYVHTFTMSLQPGARVLALDSGTYLECWLTGGTAL